MYRSIFVPCVLFALFCSLGALGDDVAPAKLPKTEALTMPGDIASELVNGADRFLLDETTKSVGRRNKYWRRRPGSVEEYNKSIAPNRARLTHILGLRDERVPFESPELVATTKSAALLGEGDEFKAYAVRWPAFGGVHGEGVLLVPEREPVADIVALPDCEQTPEMLAGLAEGIPGESQFARRLAESGCRVIIPVLINRQVEQHGRAKLSNREYLYRSAFELGRHLTGYEIQKVLACVDWFEKESDRPIGVIGYGEGGRLSLFCGALDPRIDAVGVSGYFDKRESLWQEPIDRNVYGLLEQFGDAELATMVWPRTLVVEAAKGPEGEMDRGTVGGPGRLVSPVPENVEAELARGGELLGTSAGEKLVCISDDGAGGPFGSGEFLARFLGSLDPKAALAANGNPPAKTREPVDATARHARQLAEMDRHSQEILAACQYDRVKFMSKLDTSSLDAYAKSVEWYRDYFREETIGRFDYPLDAPNPRSRKIVETDRYVGYEVVLDVYHGVTAYGILLLPKGIQEGETRPVVVCQHGLEGRPADVLEGGHAAYKAYGSRLAEEGFIVFAPQNLYIFEDRFRALQRKANPLKKTLFSIIVPQHEQITRWLKTLPQVDDERIAFYGLSYGGKSAMRIPPLVDAYCLSICSADFNEWVWKNASTLDQRYPYVWTGEYEIYEFDLGTTFNYAEMAALIAPRPFMVERGHFDGVAPDEMVAYEFAKVRHLYQARLKLKHRCEIEWFDGPHAINLEGTLEFLKRHLGK